MVQCQVAFFKTKSFCISFCSQDNLFAVFYMQALTVFCHYKPLNPSGICLNYVHYIDVFNWLDFILEIYASYFYMLLLRSLFYSSIEYNLVYNYLFFFFYKFSSFSIVNNFYFSLIEDFTILNFSYKVLRCVIIYLNYSWNVSKLFTLQIRSSSRILWI